MSDFGRGVFVAVGIVLQAGGLAMAYTGWYLQLQVGPLGVLAFLASFAGTSAIFMGLGRYE